MQSRLIAIAAAVAIAGCGGDEQAADTTPAPSGGTTVSNTPAASVGRYDGTYEMLLSRAAARRIPDPSITAGRWRLSIDRGQYALGREGAPYHSGKANRTGPELVIADSAGSRSPCGTRKARYAVTRTSTAMRLRALDEPCAVRKSLLAGRAWRPV